MRHPSTYVGLGTLVAVLIGAALAAGPAMSRVEEPAYNVVKTEPPFEVRRYGPMIVAEAQVSGPRESAINQGFRIIASYIFGANQGRRKIEMTAPVQQQAGEKIAMTAPVTQEGKGGVWTVRFVMPHEWTLQTLPKPNDPRIALKPVPPRRFAVIRFSGLAGDSSVRAREAELDRWMASNHLTPIGEPLIAYYDPPWTLPFLRRNEILREISGG